MASCKTQLLRWNQENMGDEQNCRPVNVVGIFLCFGHLLFTFFFFLQYHSDFLRGNISSSMAYDLWGLSV